MARRRLVRWKQVPPQHGRRFIITGANGGVGLGAVKALVAAGADVTLAVRDPARGEAAAAQATGPGTTSVRRLDLSSLASVREFATGIETADVLVNNAGILGVPFRLTEDGVELQLATNHLGHFALANLLLPKLTDRVVIVGSASHHHGEVDVHDLRWERRGYSPYAAYGASKLANMLFMLELQRRLTSVGSTLRVTGGHPGSTASTITANTGRGKVVTRVGTWGHGLVGMSPEQGALPVLYAATMDVAGNSYYGPHRFKEMNGWPVPVRRAPTAGDPDLAKLLWSVSEDMSGVGFSLD